MMGCLWMTWHLCFDTAILVFDFTCTEGVLHFEVVQDAIGMGILFTELVDHKSQILAQYSP